MHLFLKFTLRIELYMFRTVPLSIIRSLALYTQQFVQVIGVLLTACQRDQDRPHIYRAVLIIKPTRCTNFSNLFQEQNSTCFGQFLWPSSGVQYCTHSRGICHTEIKKMGKIASVYIYIYIYIHTHIYTHTLQCISLVLL